MERAYIEACERWAWADHWPIEDAIRLLLGLLPKSLSPEIQVDQQRDYKILFELATNCLGGSLEVHKIDLGDGPRISPLSLMQWADQKDVPVPEPLRGAVNDVHQKGASSGKRFRWPNQRHQERCKGVAALLWKQEPNVTIKAMAARRELHEFGCQGTFYAESTIYDWIKSEAGNHKPGRRSRNKTAA